MDFKEYLNKQAQKLEVRVEEVLAEVASKSEQIDPKLTEVFEKFRLASKDGKRIRGSLVLLGYRIGGGQKPESILDAAAAFEIFQTSILAQDDVIDKSMTRRLKPTLHQSLGGDHKAISQTICLSDVGLFTAYRLMSTLRIEDSLKIKALNLFSQTLTQTVFGEMLDIEAPFLERDFTDKDSYKIALLKTARYTVSGPLMVGAILAGAKTEILKELQFYGDNLGIAFQIQDDILGVFGDEGKMGKSASSDIKESKATLLIAYAQKQADRKQKEILKRYYGNEDIDDSGVKQIRMVFEKTGALDYANKQAENYFMKSSKSLKNIKEELLLSLVEYLRMRVK